MGGEALQGELGLLRRDVEEKVAAVASITAKLKESGASGRALQERLTQAELALVQQTDSRLAALQEKCDKLSTTQAQLGSDIALLQIPAREPCGVQFCLLLVCTEPMTGIDEMSRFGLNAVFTWERRSWQLETARV